MVVMIAGIATTSQLLMIIKAKISMPTLKTNQGSLLVQESATPVAMKQSMDIRDHHDSPFSEIAAPKNP